MMKQLISDIKNYALEHEVPIMSDDTLSYVTEQIQSINAHNVLELGTAIGYSSIVIAHKNPDVEIDTIERDEERYLLAMENFRKSNVKSRIRPYWLDIYDFEASKEYDVLLIDAAKAQNEAFYKKFEPSVKSGGIIIIDNMDFHGLTSNSKETEHRRNLRMMLNKIEQFEAYIERQEGLHYKREHIGDGLLVIYK